MTSWNLSQIRKKVRQVTGRFTSQEMTNEELDTRINQYYTFTFPSEVKLDKKEVYYEFTTTANQAYYDQPLTEYTNFQPPATCNNLSMLWFQDASYFFEANPLQYNFLTQWTGDGSTTNFTTTVTGFPIFPGTTTVTDNVETFVDTNQTWTTANVTVTGSLLGTLVLNYNTGTVDVTFNTAPPNGQNIYLNYVVFSPGRPENILMFNNQFQLYPVPDEAYIIKMTAWQIVAPLVNSTDTPDLNEWGPCISYGTARDIFADYGELEQYAQVTELYKEQVAYVLKRTEENMLNVRAAPNY